MAMAQMPTQLPVKSEGAVELFDAQLPIGANNRLMDKTKKRQIRLFLEFISPPKKSLKKSIL